MFVWVFCLFVFVFYVSYLCGLCCVLCVCVCVCVCVFCLFFFFFSFFLGRGGGGGHKQYFQSIYLLIALFLNGIHMFTLAHEPFCDFNLF